VRDKQYPPIGSVSTGTMLPRDLIPAFLDVLREYDPAEAARITATDSYAALEEYYDKTDDTSMYKDDAEYSNPTEPTETAQDAEDYILYDLYEALDAIAPPYCRFGAHEGDGADYGFWPSHDTIEEDRRSGELAERDDAGALTVRRLKDYHPTNNAEPLPTMAVHVNDHGNVTLYRIDYQLTEVWGIV
jgi:hypothetical protein